MIEINGRLVSLRRCARLALCFVSLTTALAAEREQWIEEPRTPDTAAWIARRIVAAQANDQPEIARRLRDLLGRARVAPCAKESAFVFAKGSIYRRKGWAGDDKRLLDVEKFGGEKLSIADMSADGNLLAYFVGDSAAAERTVRFFDVGAGRDLPDRLPGARYHTVSLGPDNEGAFYARVTAEGTRIFYHEFGGDAGSDRDVFGETYNYEPLGPKDQISTQVTDDGAYLLLSVRRGAEAKRVDVYAQELEEPDETIRPIIHGLDSDFQFVQHAGDLFVLTDHAAPKGRVVRVAIDDPNPLRWKTIVPESEETIEDLDLVGDRLYVSSRLGELQRTRIFTLEGQATGRIETPAFKAETAVHHKCAAEFAR